jgi:hypothetical protein
MINITDQKELGWRDVGKFIDCRLSQARQPHSQTASQSQFHDNHRSRPDNCREISEISGFAAIPLEVKGERRRGKSAVTMADVFEP